MSDEIVLLDSEKGRSINQKPVRFSDLGIRERQDLEKWIIRNPKILGADLLVLTTEFDRFDKSDKRLDILALDKKGKLAVVEIKRDATGSLADLQAIRYAAFCSQMTFEEVIDLRAKHAGINADAAKQQIREFVGDADFSSFDNKPRIILAAGAFDDPELMSCVLWLRGFQVDISCVEVTPYKLPGRKRLVLVPRVIIPLPEAQDYVVRTEFKEAKEGGISAADRKYRERNQQILTYFARLLPDRCPAQPWAGRFMQVPSGYGHVHFEWMHHGRAQEKMIDVAVHFEKASKRQNQKLCDFLRKHKGKIKSVLGEAPDFQRSWGEKWSAVFVKRPSEPWSEDTAKWAASKMHKLILAVQPLLDRFHGGIHS